MAKKEKKSKRKRRKGAPKKKMAVSSPTPFPYLRKMSPWVESLYFHLVDVEYQLLLKLRSVEDVSLKSVKLPIPDCSTHKLLRRQLLFVLEMKEYLLANLDVEIRFPNVMIIGTPRAAATWAKKTLARTKSLSFSAGEPRCFFDRFKSDGGNYLESLVWKEGNFKQFPTLDAINREELIQCEKNPPYLCLPLQQVEFIKMLMPDLKPLVFVRDPVDAFWSYYRFFASKEGWPQPKEDESYDLDVLEALARKQNYWNYTEGIRHWNDCFPGVGVVHFEDVFERPSDVLSYLIDFMGLKSGGQLDESLLTRKINGNDKAKSIPDDVFAVLRKVHDGQYKQWESLFGRKPKYD